MMRSMWIAGLLSVAGCGGTGMHFTELCTTDSSTQDLTQNPELLDAERLAPWQGVREVPVVWMDGTQETVTLQLSQKSEQAVRKLTVPLDDRGLDYCGWEEWTIPVQVDMTFESGTSIRWGSEFQLGPRNLDTMGFVATLAPAEFPERQEWWIGREEIQQDHIDQELVDLTMRVYWHADGTVTGLVELRDAAAEPEGFDEDTDVVRGLGVEWELLTIGGVD